MQSFHQSKVSAVVSAMKAMPARPVSMPTCVKHYGPYKSGIRAMRKQGYTFKEIAQFLHSAHYVGPKSRTTGGLSIKSAEVMICTFYHNF